MVFFLKGGRLGDVRNSVRAVPRGLRVHSPVWGRRGGSALAPYLTNHYQLLPAHTGEKRISVFNITLFLLRTVKQSINITLK